MEVMFRTARCGDRALPGVCADPGGAVSLPVFNAECRVQNAEF